MISLPAPMRQTLPNHAKVCLFLRLNLPLQLALTLRRVVVKAPWQHIKIALPSLLLRVRPRTLS
jgi:hypothetical protein